MGSPCGGCNPGCDKNGAISSSIKLKESDVGVFFVWRKDFSEIKDQ